MISIANLCPCSRCTQLGSQPWPADRLARRNREGETVPERLSPLPRAHEPPCAALTGMARPGSLPAARAAHFLPAFTSASLPPFLSSAAQEMPHTTSPRPVPPIRRSLLPARPSRPSSLPPREKRCIPRVRGLCRPSAARFYQRVPPAPAPLRCARDAAYSELEACAAHPPLAFISASLPLFLPSAAQEMPHTTSPRPGQPTRRWLSPARPSPPLLPSAATRCIPRV
jgi:hypothetical protein